jgi:hypothetical protein
MKTKILLVIMVLVAVSMFIGSVYADEDDILKKHQKWTEKVLAANYSKQKECLGGLKKGPAEEESLDDPNSKDRLEVSGGLVTMAICDLAARLGVSVEDVRHVGSYGTKISDWPQDIMISASGMVLQYGTTLYGYVALRGPDDSKQRLRYDGIISKDRKIAPFSDSQKPGKKLFSEDSSYVTEARTDLAARLGIDADAITYFASGKMYCPSDDKTIQHYVIGLMYEGVIYNYIVKTINGHNGYIKYYGTSPFPGKEEMKLGLKLKEEPHKEVLQRLDVEEEIRTKATDHFIGHIAKTQDVLSQLQKKTE